MNFTWNACNNQPSSAWGSGHSGERNNDKRRTFPLASYPIFAVVKQAEAMSRIGNVCPAQRRHFKFGLLGRRFAGGGTLDRTVRDFECSLLVVGAEREYSGTRLPFLCNMRPHRRVLWGRLAERPPAVHGVAVEQRDQESCAWEGQALADRTPLPAEIA